MAKPYSPEPEAQELYHKACDWSRQRTEAGFNRSIELFQQALERDPNYALARAGLADSYHLLAFYFVRPNDVYPKARQEAEKALALDDTLAEAHNTLACVHMLYEWKWPEAGREFERTLALDPGFAMGHAWYSGYLGRLGRHEEALRENQRALELEPTSMVVNRDLGTCHYRARRFDQAIEQYKKALELDPNFPAGHIALGGAYLQKGKFGEAIAEFETSLALSPTNAEALAGLGHAYAVGGRRREAEKTLEELMQRSRQQYLRAIHCARVLIGLEERDKAFEWLDTACQERESAMTLLKVDPIYDPLRKDPRFEKLLRRVGF